MGKHYYMGFVGVLVLLASIGMVAALFIWPIPNANRDMVNVAVGTFLGAFVSVVGYYFGSSKSSRDKDERNISA